MNYPKTIENGHGEVLTFEGLEETPDGPRVNVTAEVEPGSGPPMHTHFHQSEHLQVEEGRLWYQIQGEEPRVLEAGEGVTFRPGQPHSFRAEGATPAKLSGWVSPPDNNVYFLSQIYDSARRNNAGGRPADLDAAYLLGRYKGEYDMPEIPLPVRRVVFPVLRLIGKWTGRFAKFDDAPRPLH